MATTRLGPVGGVVELPDPAGGTEGCTVRLLGQGGQLDLASGSTVNDSTGVHRFRFSLYWPGETAADFAIINALATVTDETMLFSPPHKTTHTTVAVVPNTYRYETFEVGTGVTYYKIWLDLEEPTAD